MFGFCFWVLLKEYFKGCMWLGDLEMLDFVFSYNWFFKSFLGI